MKRTISIAAVITIAFVIAIFAGSGEDMKKSHLSPQIKSSLTVVPEGINYQGVLFWGNDPAPQGKKLITFSIYDVDNGGTALWSHNLSVEIGTGGLFSVILGDDPSNPFPTDLFTGSIRWLGIKVGVNEMEPRLAIASVPYALQTSQPDGHSLDAEDGYPTNALRVDENGNVGIGTTPCLLENADRYLTIASATDPLMFSDSEVSLELAGSSGSGTIASIDFINRSDMMVVGEDNSEKVARIKAEHSDSGHDLCFSTKYENLRVRMRITADGNVGIGTVPEKKLHLKGTSEQFGMRITNNQDENEYSWDLRVGSAGAFNIRDVTNEETRFKIDSDGDVGIGTGDPQSELHIKATSGTIGHADLRLESTDNESWNIGAGEKLWFAYIDDQGAWHDYLTIDKEQGNIGIGTSSPSEKLTVRGNILVKSASTGDPVVELGEGLDYAEGFDVSDFCDISPGAVLIIDPDNPGRLTLSTEPYDHKVAGIVTGAKGLGSGVRLGADQFDYDVALAGRVYCNVDATEIAVEPGDLLTSSGTPGYAMKATTQELAQGAILGKAMEKLAQGEKGQILVLVTLQ